MAEIEFRGNTMNTGGNLPSVGAPAPDFSLTGDGLAPVSLGDFAGKRVVLNIFPSIDTATCATSVRTFNERAAGVGDTVVLCVSADLPFAAGRFCGDEGIENVSCASTFRSPEFYDAYGVQIVDGMLAGLCARAVVVIGADGIVAHSELVNPISDEPDYDAALGAL
ncbi:MAG: thiol peroxidase [Acidimicrobiia bacterium]|nr:thiol peroxidase [Acidimicrobiia bacterium]